MTYIEFFDKTVADNICSSLTNVPDRVVLVGDKMKLLKKHALRYEELFRLRGYTVEFICRSISRSNLQSIVSSLTELVEQYDDCVFDLTGGEDLYLVAMGIVAERYPHRNIRMHRFNLQNGTVIDCDQDGRTILESRLPQMTVEENIRVYGGDVVYDTVKPEGTHVWQMSEDFGRDVLAMWDICKENVRQWNAQITALGAVAVEDGLRVEVSAQKLGDFVFIRRIMDGLYDAGLIHSYEYTDDRFSLAFKNDRVKRCLTKAGLILEMLIYTMARMAGEKDGSATYCDVMTGVCIDWDGLIQREPGAIDTENEIDVMMMHGIIPVFVSCKNGRVDIDELYKLYSVADKFGSRYARKILVATALDSESNFDEYFRQRAKDMNIRLVEGLQELTVQELIKTVRGFWSN